MKSRILFAFAALLLSASASAEMVTYSEAYELSAASVRLPATNAGTIGFRACGDCVYQTVQVTAETVWRLNGQPTTLRKFRDAMALVSDRKTQLIVVNQRLHDDRIIEVSMHVR